MKHLITSGVIVAGLLFSLGVSSSLSAQAAKPKPAAPTSRIVADTTPKNHVAMVADTACQASASTRTTAEPRDRMAANSTKVDSLAPDQTAGTLRPACTEGMGMGVGADTTKMDAKPDTARIGKP